MGRLCSPPLDARHPLAAVVVAVALLGPLAPAPADAQVPPQELQVLCVEREDKVVQANSTTDCTPRETAIQVPQTRPVHLCARDDFGLVRYTTDPTACTRDHEFPITIPDSGPQILCSKNIKNGRIQPRGELRWAASAAGCDSQFYTPFVTPAAPEAVDDTFTVDEDTQLVVPARGVLANDADVTGGPLTVRLLSSPDEGVFALAADGSLTFDPRGVFDDLDVDRSRDVTFTYATSDGVLESEPATGRITVTGRNDRPVAAADTFTTDEDSALQVVPPGVLGNDTDAESTSLSAHVVDAPAAGRLALSPEGGLTYDPTGAFDHLAVGDSADVAFTYVARDGADDSDATPVTVTVDGRNDTPVAVADTFTTDENSPLTLTSADLVANDTDAEGSVLTAVELTAGTPADAFTVAADGSITFDPTTAFDNLEDGQSGTATFTYRASDGNATSAGVTVTIQVAGISAPLAVDDRDETDEDTAVGIDILGNDTVAGATVTLQLATTRGAVTFDGAVALYDPSGAYDELAPGESLVDRFAYVLTNVEGPSRQAVVTVVVAGVDDAPVAVPDRYGVEPGRATSVPAVPADDGLDTRAGLLFNDEDADTPLAGLSAVLVSPPDRGRLTLAPDGGFTFDPAGELAEGDETTFRYRTSDGTSESATVQVVLGIGIDAPPVVLDDDIPLFVGTPPADFAYAVQASDPEGQPLGYALDPASPLFRIDPATGVITLTGAVPELGSYPLTVVVTDVQGQTDSAEIEIHVRVRFSPTDDAFSAIGNTLLLAGPTAPPGSSGVAVIVADGVLANDGAQDGSLVVDEPGSRPSALGGRVDLHADGSFSYQPPRPDPAPARGTDACDPAPSGWDGQPGAVDEVQYAVVDTVSGERRTQTVRLTLGTTVWYVDGGAAGGCGTSEEPYGGLAAVSGGDDDDAPGHTIHLRGTNRPPYDSGVVLEDRQRLLGEGVALDVDGVRLLQPGTAPTIAPRDPAGTAVTLAADNVLRGFDVASAGTGLRSTGIGTTGVIELATVSADAGPALDLAGGTTTTTIGAVTAGAAGLALSDVGGSITVGTLASGGPALVTDGRPGITDLGAATLTGAEGLHVVHGSGTVAVATLDATAVTGTPLRVEDHTGGVDVGSLASTGAQNAIHVLRGSGSVAVGDVAVSNPADHGLLVDAHAGSVAISDGSISANPDDFAGLLLRITGATGTVTNGADLLLGAVADPAAAGRTGRSLHISGLLGSATVVQSGIVVDRGAGLRLNSNETTTSTTLAGAVDAATVGSPALVATGTPLAATSTQNRLSTADGTALRLSGVAVGTGGLGLHQVTSTNAALVDGSLEQVGYGIELVDVHAAPGRLVIARGQVTTPQVGGIHVQSSSDLTVGAVTVTEPQQGGNGIDLTGTDGVLLDGTIVQRADGDGIRSHGDERLTLDGVQVTGSDGRGIHLLDPAATTTLRRTTVSGSGGVQLHVEDAGVAGPNAVVLDSFVVSGTPAEVNGIQVDTADGSNLNVRTGGTLASASLGGLNAVAATAAPGATLAVDLARFNAGGSAADAILLQADAIGDDGVSRATTLDFSLSDLTAQQSGGILRAERAGLHLVSLDGADVSGSVARAEITDTGRYGVWVEQAGPLTLTDVTVRAPEQVGVGIYDSPHRAVLDRLDVEGAPAGHAVELWGLDSVDVRDSRVDLRGLPEPEPDPALRTVTAVDQHCTNSANAESSVFPFFQPKLRADGVAGIYARQVGALTIDDTTVRGATMHQIVAFNGARIPTIDDPAGRPPFRFGTQRMTLTVSDLLLLDSREHRAGLFAGAAAGRADIRFAPGATQTVGAHLLCATDGGWTDVTGAPNLLVSSGEPALILKASGDHSLLTYLLDGTQIAYADGTPARPGTSAIQLIEESGGQLVGLLTNTTITNSPGDAVVVDGASDLNTGALTIVRPRGTGLVIRDSERVEVPSLTVTDPRGDGVLIDDSVDVQITDATISQPLGAGFVVRDSGLVRLTDTTVTNPVGSAVDAARVRDLTLRDGHFTSPDVSTANAARPGVRVRNALPLTVATVTVGAFDGIPVEIVNGAQFPGYANQPPLPCDSSPCSGPVALSGISVTDTPAGSPAVLVGLGSDTGGSVDLAGVFALDARLAVTTASAVPVTVTGGPQLTATGGGNAVEINRDAVYSPGPSPLSVALDTASISLQPVAPGATGDGLVVTGAGSTSLNATSVSGAAGDGIVVDAGDVTIVGGGVSRVAGDAIAVTGSGSATVNGASITETTGDGITISGRQQVAVSQTVVHSGGNGIHVDGAGIPAQCSTLAGNTVSGTLSSFALTGIGLSGYEPLFESVEQRLARDPGANTFAAGTVVATDVVSC